MNIPGFPIWSEADKLISERRLGESRELDEERRQLYVFARCEAIQEKLDKLQYPAGCRVYIETEALPAVRQNQKYLNEKLSWARTVQMPNERPPSDAWRAYEEANVLLFNAEWWLRELEDTEHWLLELRKTFGSAEAEVIGEKIVDAVPKRRKIEEHSGKALPSNVRAIFDTGYGEYRAKTTKAPYVWLGDLKMFVMVQGLCLRGSRAGRWGSADAYVHLLLRL